MHATKNDLRIEYLPLTALQPYARNARTHSKKQIKQIARSIERFGFVNPILITESQQIVAGHGRFESAKLLGLTTVPTLRLSYLSEAERRAYVLADNRLAEKAGWDRDLLALELQELVHLGVEIEDTGFTIGEADIIIADAQERTGPETGPEDQVPTLTGQVAVTRPGDQWILGDHRIICGDARDPAVYEALLGGDRADVVFSDPPYNVRIDGNVSGLGKIKHAEFAMASGEMSEAQFTAFLSSFLTLARGHVRDGAILFICMDWRHLFELMTAGREAGLELKNLCVWNKDNGGMGAFYRSKHELVLVFKAGDGPHTNTFELGQHGRYRTNVWDYAGVNTLKADRLDELAMHPTVKPVALVADALRDCSKRKDLVLDPFGGSGSTLIAAEKTGRRACLIELEPKYVDVTVRRWQAFTGKVARQAATGRSFEEVEEMSSLSNITVSSHQ